MTRVEGFLHRLARGLRTSARVALVVAHPDDEAFSFGGSLGLCADAVVVQLTNGSHPDPVEWRKAGVSSAAEYGAMRCGERAAAWHAADWHAPLIECGIADQCVHRMLQRTAVHLSGLLAETQIVITHPYEGGHPDHDAAAYLVQTVCDRLPHAPARLEFASYHWTGSRRATGVFWPDASAQEWPVRLTGERSTRKAAALAAYRSQARIAKRFSTTWERYRIAPRYDFTQPPPTPKCLYERKAWAVTNADLRAAFREAA